MKQMAKLLAVLCILVLFAGCAAGQPTQTESPIPEVSTPEPAYDLYFPDSDPYQFTSPIAPDQTVHLDKILMTNTRMFKIKNKGDTAIICNLYYPNNLDDFILTCPIEPGETGKFSSLTSALTYCIGFQSAESGTLEVTISG